MSVWKKETNLESISMINLLNDKADFFGDDRNTLLEDSLKSEYGWTLKIPWGWTE